MFHIIEKCCQYLTIVSLMCYRVLCLLFEDVCFLFQPSQCDSFQKETVIRQLYFIEMTINGHLDIPSDIFEVKYDIIINFDLILSH